uniref:Uncharacterized protein n=1 Tax=Erpetoichthys calabaricus TaxID=27687 RepID=A0A8C4XE88_ERPCA
ENSCFLVLFFSPSAAPAIVCAQQLTCPVCLDIFTSPISTPCGHSFCMECITRYWGRSGDCICPFCKKIFRQRPDLNINRTLFKAVKSCLVCLASFCNEPLELFCMTDQTYICLLCGVKEHKIHNTVHIEVEWKSAHEETEESTKSLDELMQIIEKKREDVVRLIETKETTKVNQTEHLIKLLEQDIQRLEGLLKPNDYFNCLVVMLFFLYINSMAYISQELYGFGGCPQTKLHLTLDPHTASPSLTLSADGKEVCYGDAEQEIPDNPLRFDIFFSVLSKEGFTSGRHYWEVKVGEKTDWILGVVRESINRKGDIELCPQNGYWTVSLCYGSGYWAFTSPSTFLALNIKPRKVGVFLDYEEGQLSFYNLELRCHLYTFIANFTKKLYPYLCPFIVYDDKNSAPLIISNWVLKQILIMMELR